MFLTDMQMKQNYFTKKRVALLSALCCAAALSAAVGVAVIGRQNRESVRERYDAPLRGDRQKPVRPKPKAESENGENGEEEEVLLFEDFSGFTDGTEDEPGAWIPSDYETNYAEYYLNPGDVPAELTKQPGWKARGVRQAGGAAYMGDPILREPYLELPPGNYFGRLKLSFRVKNVNPEEKNTIFVSFGQDDIPRELIAPGDWQEVTFEFDNTSSSPDYAIAFACYTYSTEEGLGFLIDDVKLTRSLDFTVTPENPLAMGFNENGFTAWWNPACQADHYLVNLWEEVTTSDDDVEVNEDFSEFEDWEGSILMTDGWSVEGNDVKLSEDGGVDGSQGVILYEKNQKLIWEGTGGRIMDFSVFVKTLQIADIPSEDRFIDPYFALMGYNDEGWESLGTLMLSELPEEGIALDLPLFIQSGINPTGIYTKFAVIAKYFEEGDQLLVDDAYFLTTPSATRTLIKENVRADENKLVFDDLDPWNEYYFDVTSVTSKGSESAPTLLTHAFGIAAPEVNAATDVEQRGAYTANWEPAAKAESYVVKNYRSTRIDMDYPGYSVIKETFDKGKGDGDLVNIEGADSFISLDKYADNTGWTAYHGCMCDGMVGARGDYNELRTPEITLNHNDGQFTVRITVWGVPGDRLVVQSYDQYSIIEFKGEGNDLGLVRMEGSMDFSDGQRHGVISMYTVYGDPFVVDDFEIVQDVAKDDRIMTLVEEAEVDASTLEYRFNGLKRTDEYDYSYCVIAKRQWFDGSGTVSDPSCDQIVSLTDSVDEMAADNMSVYSADGVIVVRLVDDACITVYDMAGRVERSLQGKTGSNIIPVGKAGAYIVRVLDSSVKIIVM